MISMGEKPVKLSRLVDQLGCVIGQLCGVIGEGPFHLSDTKLYVTNVIINAIEFLIDPSEVLPREVFYIVVIVLLACHEFQYIRVYGKHIANCSLGY